MAASNKLDEKSYREYLESQDKGDIKAETPDWEGYRAWAKEQGEEVPSEAPSNLADVHLKVASGLLGNVAGTVTDTVGGITGGLTGKDKS